MNFQLVDSNKKVKSLKLIWNQFGVDFCTKKVHGHEIEVILKPYDT